MIRFFVVALLALVSACRGNTVVSLAPSEDDEGSSGANSDATRRSATSGIRGDAYSGKEDDTADFPQEIAGSFLTCGRSSGSDSAERDLYGCRVERKAQVVSIDRYSPVWGLEDGGGEVDGAVSSGSFRTLPPGSTWQVEVNLPQGLFKTPRVRVRLDFGDDRKGSLSRSLTEAAPYLTLAHSKTLHLGDGALLLPLALKCGLDVGSARAVGKSYQAKLTIAEQKTAVSLSLGGLCGVDYGSNSVTIKSLQGETIVKGEFKPGAKLFHLSTPVLEPGIYEVEIVASLGHLGLDDFLIGEVMATVTEPKAKIKLEPSTH